MPTNVATPAATSANGTRSAAQPSRRTPTQAPSTASTATGGRTVALTNATNEPGTAARPCSRPRSSASSEVACSDHSGSPVTTRSTRAQASGGATSATVRTASARRPDGRTGSRQSAHSQYSPARTHASGRSSPASPSSVAGPATPPPRRSRSASRAPAQTTSARNGASTYARIAYSRNEADAATKAAASSPGQRPNTAAPSR